VRKSDAIAYQQRWEALREIELQELRSASIEERWLQVNAIYDLARSLGLPLEGNTDPTPVYARWAKLKQNY